MSRFVLISFWMAVPGLAQVVSYEATSGFPEEEGAWVHNPENYQADRWIEDGLLVQYADVIFPQGIGEQDTYYYSLAGFTGCPTWFVEWRVETNGPSEAIPAVAPVALAAGGTLGILYHFTIADDQVRFIQDVAFPYVWVDIESGVLHTYRLELLDGLFYWFIDGQLVNAASSEGPYPTVDSELAFRCMGAILDGMTICLWDYVRFGKIPPDASGDFDSDSNVNLADFYFFQECLTTPSGSWPGCAWADMDSDGDTDCADRGLFQAAWTAPEDPPVVAECVCGMADLNATGAVDATDLAMLLAVWGANPGDTADLNADGVINASDLALLLGAWGACP